MIFQENRAKPAIRVPVALHSTHSTLRLHITTHARYGSYGHVEDCGSLADLGADAPSTSEGSRGSEVLEGVGEEKERMKEIYDAVCSIVILSFGRCDTCHCLQSSSVYESLSLERSFCSTGCKSTTIDRLRRLSPDMRSSIPIGSSQ